MLRRQAFLRLCACVVLLAMPAVSFGQGQALHVSEAEYQQFPVWQAEPEGAGAPPKVDLRPWLPKVGNQGQEQSCVAWAVGYVAKTHLERRKRGWRLDTQDHVFSPAFIYNQINGGKDRGSRIPAALDLLVSKGCASLATMPYKDGDFLATPPAAAYREAARFRSKGWAALKTGDMLRTALRQQHVVVVMVRQNPTFNTGKFKVYTPQELRGGQAQLSTGAPKSNHCMAVVGYDDVRGAFLVMNSWGDKWGERGCCWIDYRVMKTINPSANNFVIEAYLLLDHKAPAAPIQRPTLRGLASLDSAQLLDWNISAD